MPDYTGHDDDHFRNQLIQRIKSKARTLSHFVQIMWLSYDSAHLTIQLQYSTTRSMTCSNTTAINCSVLCPLLFVIHINNFPSFIILVTTLLFADDTKLSKAVSSSLDCPLLQQDIHPLEWWSCHSGLSFNVAKIFLHFSSHFLLISEEYTLNGSVIPHVSSCRGLGLVFWNLSRCHHYKAISKSAYGQLSLI